MRTTFDRIRQAILFEGVALVILVTVGMVFLDLTLAGIGVIAVAGSVIATVLNYVYNLLFDLALTRQTGSAEKSLHARVIHTLGFEISMLLLMLPFVMWWLDLTFVHALLFDMSFTLFYLFYTFAFTWAYDRIFPAPAPISGY
ncbi:PACE efflux transporter [Neptunicoccus cionae]|uniref:Membrane protein n=1 Tax=Neptunicoccus cionae TaxID=2035344 RepID=A0A916QUG7_9RHOB|nr:PACE efflux transporter [Amylibacter cionae]GGA12359.1 membrane protein [Amylibacter cionae]